MAVGDISTAIQTLRVYDGPNNLSQPLTRSDLVHIAGDYYCFISRDDTSKNGRITTVKITEAGAITYIDSWIFEGTTNGYSNSIFKVSGTSYYIIEYSDTNWKGQVATVSISDVGAITASIVNSAQIFTYSECSKAVWLKSTTGYEYFVSVTSGTYSGAVATEHGGISVYKVNTSTGAITVVTGANDFNGTTTIYMPIPIRLADDMICVLYKGMVAGSALLRTISFSGDTIANLGVDTETVAASGASVIDAWAWYPAICKVSSTNDVYAVGYTNSSNHSQLCTYTITTDGAISSQLHIYDYHTASPTDAALTTFRNVCDGIIAIAYNGTNFTIGTFAIDSSGVSNATPINTVTFGGYSNPGIGSILGKINTGTIWGSVWSRDKGDICVNTARIEQNDITTINSDGTVIHQKDITSDGHITTTDTVTKTSDSWVQATEFSTISSDSHVKTSDTIVITSDSYVTITNSTTITSDSYVGHAGTCTLSFGILKRSESGILTVIAQTSGSLSSSVPGSHSQAFTLALSNLNLNWTSGSQYHGILVSSTDTGAIMSSKTIRINGASFS